MKDGKYEILCIDDDKDILDALRLFLESKGYAMHEAYSAEEGLKVYKKHKIDFVIVDSGLMDEMCCFGSTSRR